MTIGYIIGIIVGSDAALALAQYLITRHFDRKDVVRQTLAAVSYAALSDKIEKRLDDDYASPEQRQELKILYEAYKANGWNGDMDERIKKVYSLPTKRIG